MIEMRATSVLAEGLGLRPSKHNRHQNPFVQWDDGVEEEPASHMPPRYAKATEVTVCEPPASATRVRVSEEEPISVSVVRKRLPATARTRVDLTADDEEDGGSWWESVKEGCREVFGSTARFELMLRLTLADANVRRGSYMLSFCSVCSVVCVCVVMLSILASFAIVSLHMAEESYGTVDMEMTPGGFAASATSLNYTRVAEVLKELPAAQQVHTYKVELSAAARRQSTCTLTGGSISSLWYKPVAGSSSTLPTGCPNSANETTGSSATCTLCQGSCASAYCTDNGERISLAVVDPKTNFAFVADSSKPRKAAVMSSLPYGSVMISEALQAAMKVNTGDQLVVTASMNWRLWYVMQQIPNYSAVNPDVLLSLKIGAVIDDGFYPGTSNDFFILVPPAHFTALMVDGMAPSVSVAARAIARLAKPAEYASKVLFQMPSPLRQSVYLAPQYSDTQARVRDWGALVTEKLGANQITMSTPILSVLARLQYFSSFVGLIISVIVLALGFLSVILIYTLLSIGVETKTYELGIQRMIGFTRMHLVALIFTNTYTFTIPAWLFGLVTGQISYWIVRAIIKHYSEIPLSVGVSGSAVGWATLAGLGVPLIAALLPIRSLISMALPDALNTSRGRGTGVVYHIQQGRSRETDVIIFGLGFLGALSGFSMYFFFPNSLITLNYPLMFYILFLVLLGMLSGLVLLATNFQRVMETVLRYLFMFWEAPAVFAMVAKSLSAHRQRNQQTTIMYALSVGFIVFITVAFQIEVESIEYSSRRSSGTNVNAMLWGAQRPSLGISPLYAQTSTTGIAGATYAYEPSSLHPEYMMGVMRGGSAMYFADLIELERDLHAELGSTMVTGFTYRMAPPQSAGMWPVKSILLKTYGQMHSYRPAVAPIPPNFYSVVEQQFIKVNKYGVDAARYGLSGGLYAEDSLNKAIIATTTNRVFALNNLSSRFLWETRVSAFSRGIGNSNATLDQPSTEVLLRTGQPAAVMDSSPVFLMTKFPNNMGEVLVSIPTAAHLTGIPYVSCNAMSVQHLYVRVNSAKNYDAVKAFLRHWLSQRWIGSSISDETTRLETIKTVDTTFSVFFVITQIVIMLICFFSLMSSMTANVLDSSKEIGVLLCLGMPHMQIYRIYVWEAFLLVVSSGFLGLLVGMAVAETMLLQSALFTQLSTPFPFPYVQLIIMIAMGFGSALASSISPVLYLLRLPSITHILRRVI